MRLPRPAVPLSALAILLAVPLSAGPARAESSVDVDRALALARQAPAPDDGSIAFRSRPARAPLPAGVRLAGLPLAAADPLLRPSVALLRTALQVEPPSLLRLSAAGREDGARGPAALHRWRILLGLRWPF